MPLAPSFRLTPNFTAGELNASDPLASAVIEGNLRRVAEWLEVLRSTLRVPLRVTSGFRPPARNANVGGTPSSNHLDGLAADVAPVGMKVADARVIILANLGSLPMFDQIILYPASGHIHIGLGPRNRGEVRVMLYEGSGGMPILANQFLQELGGTIAGAGAAVVASPAAPFLGIGLALLFGFLLLALFL